MAVKLPTRDQLGPLPSVRGGRRVAQISPSAAASSRTAVASAMAVGAGVGNLGAGLEKAGNAALALHQHEQKNEAFEVERQFQEFDWNQRLAVNERMRTIQPGSASDFANSVQQDYQKNAQEFYKTVPEHLKAVYDAKLFSTERDLYGSAASFAYKEQERFATEGIDKTFNNVYLPKARVSTSDEIDKVADDFEKLVRSNPNLTPIKQDEIINKRKRDLAWANVDGLPPEQAQAFLNSRLAGATATLPDKIERVESGGRYNATNPNSSAAGPGQFIRETWLDMVKRNRPDVAEGRSDNEILALRTDPKYRELNKEMIAAYAAENTEKLQKAGINPTPGNVYLSHFLGPGDAQKVLTADPNTPIANIVTAKAFNANRSVMEGKTAGDLAKWADRKMAGPAGGTFASLNDDDWNKIQQNTDTRLRAQRVDAEHQIQLAKQQAKAVSDEAENEFFGRIVKNDPAITASVIADDKRLTPDTKRQMLTLLEHVNKGDRADATYGKEFFPLFKRIHAPEGDPNRITDPAALYDFVGKDGGLTVSGLDKLRAEMNGKKTPEGAAEAEMKKQFLQTAERVISGRNDTYGIRDPKGDELYLKFLGNVLPAYDAARAKGVPAVRLLDPDSPDYIAKGLLTPGAGFVRTPTEKTAAMLADYGGNAAGGAKPAFDTSTPQGLILAVQSGKVSRAEGESIALKNGWIRPAVAPPRR